MIVFAKVPIFTLFLFFFIFFSKRISEKQGNKKTIKNSKKVLKDEMTITLKLDNGVEIPAKHIYIKKIQKSLK